MSSSSSSFFSSQQPSGGAFVTSPHFLGGGRASTSMTPSMLAPMPHQQQYQMSPSFGSDQSFNYAFGNLNGQNNNTSAGDWALFQIPLVFPLLDIPVSHPKKSLNHH